MANKFHIKTGLNKNSMAFVDRLLETELNDLGIFHGCSFIKFRFA